MTIRGISPRPSGTNKDAPLELDPNIETSNVAFTSPLLEPFLFAPNRMVVYSWFLSSKTNAKELMEDALTRGGFNPDTANFEEGDDPLVRTAAEYEALLDNSLSPTEVSEMLAVAPSEVLRRLEGRSLYGVLTDDGWRILEFQFEEGRLLPRLEEVLSLLHEELHLVAVYRWFVSPSVDLTTGDQQVSPRQWLLNGGNVATVARIAIDL